MYILGINAYHGDSSACIFKDGKLIAAIEEERIRRIKHWAGLPVEAIRFCLNEAEISISEVDHITISRDPKAKLGNKIFYALGKISTLTTIRDRAKNSAKVKEVVKEIYEELDTPYSDIDQEKLKFVEHHRCHHASAFYASDFRESALLSIDGMGDFTSTMMGHSTGNKIDIYDSVSYPHSLGYFYTALTQYLGFPNYGDEYKVMGLAPYGTPNRVDELREIIPLKSNGKFSLNPKYFDHFKNGITMSWEGGSPEISPLFSEGLVKKLGPARDKTEELLQEHMDLAASVQKLCEEVIFHLCEGVYKKTKSENLCLSGGVAQNSVANGKILDNTSFKNVYIPPAGHDAGTATGSAMYYYHHVLGNEKISDQNWAYTGARFFGDEIRSILDNKGVSYFEYDEESLYDVITDALIDSSVIGWFQGRSEFGPRALGNRSILVDPRREDAKELLNEKIKRRESFRPFAPSILEEYVDEYFEKNESVPYMEKVLKIKAEKHSVIPAVTHVDGTGRLQSVSTKTNLRYHNLISAFHAKTGVPILLNTSFNENEPIVNTPEEALDCFLRTRMDMLVMENIIVSRR